MAEDNSGAKYSEVRDHRHLVAARRQKPKKRGEAGRRGGDGPVPEEGVAAHCCLLRPGLYNEHGIPVCIGSKVMDYLGTGEDGSHQFRCPAGGCHLKEKMDWSRYCDFESAEKSRGTLLKIMGVIHRASTEWKRLFRMRPAVERWFSSAKHSRLLDQHQYLGLERGKPARKNVTVGLPADLLGTAEGRGLRGDAADAHQPAKSPAGNGTQSRSGVRGVPTLSAA